MDDAMRLDATALRVLAHPLRTRLLSALRLHGPATATELAGRLTTNTGATSYHLRQLESVGLVVDTGDGVGRRRLWRASTSSHAWTPSAVRGDADAEAAQGWLVRDYARQSLERFEGWLDVEQAWPDAWRDAVGYSDAMVTVTPEQAAELAAELDALVSRFRDAGADEPRARRVMLTALLHPFDPAAQPTDPAADPATDPADE